MAKENQEEIDFRRILHAFVSTAALGIAIFITMWIIDYANKQLQTTILSNINFFLTNSWPIIIGFVLLIQIWEYIYPIRTEKLKYLNPLINAVSILFGLWLVVVFIDGLRFFNQNAQVDLIMAFPAQLFFTQIYWIIGLAILVKYAQFFLKESKTKQ